MVNNDYAIGAKGVRDEHIVSRAWLPFDFDSTSRPKELSASGEEIDQANEVAGFVKDELTDKGWPDPIFGMSGNGHHLLYAVDLPHTEETAYMIRRLYLHLAYHVKFTVAPMFEAAIKFDTVCHNPSRIWKFYGTKTKKGEPTEDRPHRLAVCDTSGPVNVVPTMLLEQWAFQPGAEKKWLDGLREPRKEKGEAFRSVLGTKERPKTGKGDYSTLDIVQLFEDKEMYRFPIRSEPGKHSVFCPWAANHSSPQTPQQTDTVVWEPDPSSDEDERKWPVFHCSHEGCSEASEDGKRTFDSLRKLWTNSLVDKYCKESFDDNPFNSIKDELVAQGVSATHSTPPTNNDERQEVIPKSSELNPPEPDRPKDPPPATGQVVHLTPESIKKQEQARARQQANKEKSEAERPTFSPLIGLGATDDNLPPLEVRWRWLMWAAPKIKKCEHSWSHSDEPNVPEDQIIHDSDEGPKPLLPAGTSKPKSAEPPAPAGDQNDTSQLGIKGDRNNNPEFIHRNLIAINGTTLTYHVGKDDTMTLEEVRHSFPILGGKWLKSAGRRSVDKDDFIFNPLKPGYDPEFPLVVNRFRGLPKPPSKGVYPKLILGHLFWMCEDYQTTFDYTLNWMALPIQQVGTKMESALIFKGVQGTGKNLIFTRWVNDIYGKYGVTVGATQLASQYNEWMACRLFILANEVSTRRDRVDIQNKVKAWITDRDMMISEKFKSSLAQKNYFNMVFLSNDANPMTIEQGDRRYQVCERNTVPSDEYFAALGEEVDAGGIFGLYHLLMERDLSGFTRYSKPPMTKTKADSIADRMSPHIKFLDRIKKNDVDMPMKNLAHAGVFLKADLWQAFQIWKRFHGYTSSGCTATVFYHRADRELGAKRTFNVRVEKPGGKAPRTKRSYYIIGDATDEISGQEAHQRSLLFKGCVAANTSSTSSTIELIDTFNREEAG